MTSISANGLTEAVYLQMSGTNVQYSIGTLTTPSTYYTITWPFTITNSGTPNILRVSATQTLTISNSVGSTNGYIIAGSSHITFDGSGAIINISSITNYRGFIQNGSGLQTAAEYIIVKNFTTNPSSSSLQQFSGWLCQAYFGNGALANSITNCTNNSTGTIATQSCGGIVGYAAGSLGGTLDISGCTNNAVISGSQSGGIAADDVGSNGSVIFTNCINNGNITSTYCGGIAGYRTGNNSGSVIFTNCINTGAISGNSTGGISGYRTGNNNGLVIIKNSFNTGNITGQYAGGIVGPYFAYTSGQTCIISGCYNTGTISTANYTGGIVGANVGLGASIVDISNCYSLGAIGTTNGGICGGWDGTAYPAKPTIRITNTYSSGTLVDAGSGLVATSLTSTQITLTTTNTYVAAGSWTDANANAALTGTPISVTSGNPGTTWTKIDAATSGNPYVLSAFNANLYNPNNVTASNTYTSSPGLFTDPSYNYKIIYTSQTGGTAIIRVFVYKGTTSNYNSYNFNTFTITIAFGGTDSITPAINSLNGVLTIPISSSLQANGGTQYVSLKMNNSGTLVQYSTDQSTWLDIDSSVWPVRIQNTGYLTGNILRVVATQNLTMTTTYTGGSNGYFIAGSSYITFDGSGNTINLNSITNYQGFIQNGTSSASSSYSNVIVQNFITNATSSTLDSFGGWLCQQYFGRDLSGNLIFNCTNNANLTASVLYLGGIVGSYAGSSGGTLTITNCTNNAVISAPQSGGIAGSNVGTIGGKVIFTNCSNTSDIDNNISAGIVANNAGNNNGTITITNCTNTGGLISGFASGGIVSSYAGSDNGTITITNCSNNALISGISSGGIVGNSAGYQNGLVTITNSFNTGNITGQNAGGIAGDTFAFNTSRNCVISSCYSTGSISGDKAGGIVGRSLGLNTSATYPASVVDISNCYSLGTIATTCGGIVGGASGSAYPNKPIIRITNTYSSGTLVDPGTGLVAASFTSTYYASLTTPNTYVAAGSWTDAAANAALTGTPTDISTNNPGTRWTKIDTAITGNPYVLSAFNAAIYSPSSASASTTYTTDAGLFTPNYNYKIIYTSQTGGTAIIRVFVYKGTTSNYNSYNFNTFSITNSTGSSNILSPTINSLNGVLTIPILSNSLTANGATERIYLQMSSGNLLQFSIGNLITPASWYDIVNWPVTITNSNASPGPSSILKVVSTQNLTMTTTYTGGTSGYFIPGSQYLTFDGSGNTITINSIPLYPGFIQNGTASANGYANIVVQNYTTNMTGSSLATSGTVAGGWLCQMYYGKGVTGITISNCTNNCSISENSAGGLAGSYVGDGGGVIFTSCTNTGIVSGIGAGGIVGAFAATSLGSVTLTSCISTGLISGRNAGGFVGQLAGSANGLVTLTNCFSTGNITATDAGGITGSQFAYNTNKNCIISGCYSTGAINNTRAGGIVGANVGYNDNATYAASVVDISNCYSLGTIATGAGGICGGWLLSAVYTTKPTIRITNTYSSGTLVDVGSGMVANSLRTSTQIILTTTNTYVAAGTWVDANAKATGALIGTPTNLTSSNPGTNWASIATNTPYVLYSNANNWYNAQIYNPNSASSSNTYISSTGLFTDPSYNYTIVYNSQSVNVITIHVFVYKGSASYYNSYNNNIFTFTNLTGSSDTLSPLINSSNGQLTIRIPFAISANGATQYVSLQMNNSSTLIQYSTDQSIWTDILSSDWPVTITNTNPGSSSILNVKATQPLTISSSTGGTSGYFIAGTTYIRFDGSGNTITINTITSYPGFIQNGTASVNGKSNIAVQNFTTTISGGSTLATNAGWLCQSYFSNAVAGNTITNCTNNGDMGSNNGGGGIVGAFASANSGVLDISGCTNTGSMSSTTNAGGIAGRSAGYINSTLTFTNCTNSGVTGSDGGGIAGISCARSNSTVTITNCTNTGNITSNTSGGIAGPNAGLSNGLATFTGCTNYGIISGQACGGIVPNNAGSSGTCIISNCFNRGNITSTALYAGGIAGSSFGRDSITCIISNCYNTGDVTANFAGGIVGANTGENTSLPPIMDISCCYSIGLITTGAGGIVGGNSAGVYTNTPTIRITNCYAYNNTTPANSNIIASTYPYGTPTYCYAATTGWTDASANAALAGTPTSLTLNNPGTTWTKVVSGTTGNPYVLAAYNAALYSPSSASAANNYTTSAGLYTDSSYSLVYSSQTSNTATIRVFAYKGTSPKYYSYNFNTFAFTNSSPLGGTIGSRINTSTGVLAIGAPALIAANGATEYVSLRMDTSGNNTIQYSTDQSAWSTLDGSFNWPVTIRNTNPAPGVSSILRTIATQNLTISSNSGGTSSYFIMDSSYITLDGSGNTMTITGITSYPGFIQNGTSSVNGKSNIAVQNFTTTISGASTLADEAGWLCQSYFSNAVAGNTITSCTNNGGNISGTNAGGVVGSNFGGIGSSITGCTNTGPIDGTRAGGIVGKACGRGAGKSATITSCTNTGTISASSAGGIAGGNCGNNSGTCNITSCTNTGTISGQSAGGIVGSSACEFKGTCNITKCISTGNITGSSSGGITGSQFAYDTSTNNIISNCYSIGNISGTNAGGIVGLNVGSNDVALGVSFTPVVDISNCYSLGTIATSCGGICGGSSYTYTNKATINITNSYSYGALSGTGAGLVAASLTSTNINLTTTNTYVAAGSWTDAAANAALTGTPTDISTNNPGTTWTKIDTAITGNPYVLSAYDAQIYDPNNASATSNFTTNPGLFTDPSYNYTIINNAQNGNYATTYVFVYKGTSPYYNFYNTNTYHITNTSESTKTISAVINSSTGVIDYSLPSYPCFLEGSKILCLKNNKEVYLSVESLRKGDLVKTINNGYVPIYMIGTTAIDNPGNDLRIPNRLYKCSKDIYTELFEDLYITGCHSILVPYLTDDQWNNTKELLGDIYITDNHFRLMACVDEWAEPFNQGGIYNIYHIALENEHYYRNYGIYANGLLVETCSKRYLSELSNMRILGEEDCATIQEMYVDGMPNQMIQMVDTY